MAEPRDAIPDVLLERYLAADLPARRVREIEAQLATSTELRTRVEGLRTASAAYLATQDVDALAHHLVTRLAIEKDVRRAPRLWRWLVGPSVAAATGLVLSIVYLRHPEPPPAIAPPAQIPAMATPSAKPAPRVATQDEGEYDRRAAPPTRARKRPMKVPPSDKGFDDALAGGRGLGVGVGAAAPSAPSAIGSISAPTAAAENRRADDEVSLEPVARAATREPTALVRRADGGVLVSGASVAQGTPLMVEIPASYASAVVSELEGGLFERHWVSAQERPTMRRELRLESLGVRELLIVWAPSETQAAQLAGWLSVRASGSRRAPPAGLSNVRLLLRVAAP